MKENPEEQIRIVREGSDNLTVSRRAFEAFYKKRGYQVKGEAENGESVVDRAEKTLKRIADNNPDLQERSEAIIKKIRGTAKAKTDEQAKTEK